MINIYKNGRFVPLVGEKEQGKTIKDTDKVYAQCYWYDCGTWDSVFHHLKVYYATDHISPDVNGTFIEIDNPWKDK